MNRLPTHMNNVVQTRNPIPDPTKPCGRNTFIRLYVFIYVIGMAGLLHLGWANFWTLVRVPALSPCFADMRTVQSGLASIVLGYNPQLNNPSDPWGRTMNYPLVWLDVANVFKLHNETCFLIFCFIIVFVYFIAGCYLLYKYPSGFLLAALISWSSFLGVERCNNDILIFALAIIFACSRPVTSGIAILVATCFKVYPLFALHALLAKRKFLRLALIGSVVGVSIFILLPQLPHIQSGNTASGHGAYGVPVLLNFVSKRLALDRSVIGIFGYAIFSALVYFIHRASPLDAFHKAIQNDSPESYLFLTGGSIYVYTYLFAANWDYRLVFTSLCVPLLACSKRGWIGKTISFLIIVAMNVGWLKAIWTPLFIFTILAKLIIAVFISALIMSPVVDLIQLTFARFSPSMKYPFKS